jgi:hypothetical protein
LLQFRLRNLIANAIVGYAKKEFVHHQLQYGIFSSMTQLLLLFTLKFAFGRTYYYIRDGLS